MRDVVNIAHVTGRRLLVSGNEEKVSDIQTPEEGTDRFILARAMQEGLSRLRARCARYVNSGKLSEENVLEDMTGCLTLELCMPDTWNFGIIEALTDAAHACLVSHCVAEMFEKTSPEEAGVYREKALYRLSEVKRFLEMRTAPVIRPVRIF